MTLYAALAAGIVALHLLFVVFVACGGFLALRWPRIVWAHLPSVAWAAYVELSGRLCPLTPLENMLRKAAGLEAYSGDFIARYVFPVLYPEGLTRDAQFVIGIAVVCLNAALYGWLLWRRMHKGTARRPSPHGKVN